MENGNSWNGEWEQNYAQLHSIKRQKGNRILDLCLLLGNDTNSMVSPQSNLFQYENDYTIASE